MTTEPSARVTVNEKPMPGVNTDELTSDANTKNIPPSATAKLTVPVPALSSAPSRLAAAPRAQFAVARAQGRRGRDREGDRELGGRDHRRRGDRDAGAEGGARPRLEVRARHAHREARPRRSRAW